MAQHATALEWLTRRTDSITSPSSNSLIPPQAVSTLKLPPPASTSKPSNETKKPLGPTRVPLDATMGSRRSIAPLTRAHSWDSIASEATGYRTAEEDVEDAEQPSPTPALMTPIPQSPLDPGSAASPAARPWGADSAWNCVGAGDSSTDEVRVLVGSPHSF